MKIIRPKYDFAIPYEVPYFYLIGPVLGGGDWQHGMCRALEQRVGECVIAVPNRWSDEHPLAKYFVGEKRHPYLYQLDWENVYIRLARERAMSCLVCYLPEENMYDPRTDGNPYGRDTYREIGEFCGHLQNMDPEMRQRFPLAFGGSERFPGFELLERRLRQCAHDPHFPTRRSLVPVADLAMTIVFKK